MPTLKEGSTIARYSAKPVIVAEVPAPSGSDPGFYLQIDNVPQPNDAEGNAVEPRMRLSISRHAGQEHNTWSVYVDEAEGEIGATVEKLIEMVLAVANPVMGFGKVIE